MEQLGGYRLVVLLAEGGMGQVHLGRSASGRLVAVKTVHEHLAADPLFRERFRREALAARAVDGPFTAAVLDADPGAVRPWLATEFCTGPTLTGAVSALGPLDSGELATLGAALAEALAAVHAAGLVHRDLKPSNVVIAREGPMVIDFGIARTAADESLTGSGEIVGSPGFIAPELLTGAGEPGPAVDVFALGALLAYAATGRAPFGTGAAHQVLYRTMHGEADLDGVGEMADGPAWRELLERCLSDEPGGRPGVSDVLDECRARTVGDPWWEREAVSALIGHREDEVAALVGAAADAHARGDANADGDANTGGDKHAGGATDASTAPAKDVAPTAKDAKAARAPGGYFAPVTGPAPSRRRFLLWGGGALVGGAAVAGFAALAAGGEDDTADPAVRYTRGRALWTHDIGEARLLAHRDALYLLGSDVLTRLDAATGAVTWTYPAPDLLDVVPGTGLVHVLRSSVVSTVISALNPANGAEKWSADTLFHRPRREAELGRPKLEGADAHDGALAALCVSADLLCVATYTSYSTLWAERAAQNRRWRAYGYHTRTGEARWFHQGGAAEVTGMHQAGGRIAVASARQSAGRDESGGYGGRTGDRGQPLAVLRAADGTLEREIPGGSRRVQAHPGSAGVRYYAAGPELSSVDLASRRTQWSRKPFDDDASDLGATITPTARGGLVHTAADRALKALDADSGKTRWSNADAGWSPDGASPLVAGGLVYTMGREPGAGKTDTGTPSWGVHALDAATGELVWGAETGAARAIAVSSAAGTDALGDASDAGADARTDAAADPGLVHVSARGTLSAFAPPEPI